VTLGWVLVLAALGALGTLARWGVGELLPATSRLPAATLAVNLVGSLAIGIVVGVFASRGDADARLRVVLTVGLLGGFTTYSSFALDAVQLLERRQIGLALGYVAVTVVAGLGACALGLWLTRR